MYIWLDGPAVSSIVLLGSGPPGSSTAVPEFTDMMLSWFIVFYLPCFLLVLEKSTGGILAPTALPANIGPGGPYMLDLKLWVGLPRARFMQLCCCSRGSTSVRISNCCWMDIWVPSMVEAFPLSNCDELCIIEFIFNFLPPYTDWLWFLSIMLLAKSTFWYYYTEPVLRSGLQKFLGECIYFIILVIADVAYSSCSFFCNIS